MSVKFIKVQRKVLAGEDVGKTKTYARVISSNRTKISQLCKLVSARASISGADVKAVFDSLIFAVEYELCQGNIIELGELGTFRLSISSEGVEEDPENNIKLKSHHIKKARVLFTPSTSLLHAIADAEYEPLKPKDEVECEKPHSI